MHPLMRERYMERFLELAHIHNDRYVVTKQPFGFWEEWGNYCFQDLFDRGERIICTIRDPRDVAVSHNPHAEQRYFWHPKSWERTANEILLHQNNPDLLVIKYEELVVDTDIIMRRIANFLHEEVIEGYDKFHEEQDVDREFQKHDSAELAGKRVWDTLGGWGVPHKRPISPDRIGQWRKPENREQSDTVSAEIRMLARRLGYDMTEV